MAHKIEISDRTYSEVKEYCQLNGLKIGQFVDKLLHDGLMIEKYGDVPFTNYRKPLEIESVPVPDYSLTVPKEEVEAVVMDSPSGLPVGGVFEDIDNEFNKGFNNMLSTGEEGYRATDEGIKAITPEEMDEALKNAGVPTKVINKINKRRLK